MRKLIVGGGILLALGLGTVAAPCFFGHGAVDASGTTFVGQTPPEIACAKWANTAPVTLADLRGRVVMLEFWATW